MKPLLVPALALLFSGCHHFSGYQQPYGDDTAEITFTSNDTAAQPVICVPGEGFQSTDYSIAQQPIGGDSMNELMEAMKKSPEVRASVAAGSSVTAGFRYTRRDRFNRDRCQSMVSFDAVAGETYQLRLEKSPECAITTTRLDGESWVAQETQKSDASCD